MGLAELRDPDRDVLADVAPVLRRCVDLDSDALVRLRLAAGVAGTVGAFVRLPFGVLIARTVEGPDRDRPVDVAVRAIDALRWLDREQAEPPSPRDHEWRGGLPPTGGWSRIDTVPDDVVRPLVRQGALALKDAAAREGVPGAQPRAEVADALLDSVVLTVSGPAGVADAEITLRAVSALTRMGFLPRGGSAHIDAAGRWVRVAAAYGTVYLERPGGSLTLR